MKTIILFASVLFVSTHITAQNQSAKQALKKQALVKAEETLKTDQTVSIPTTTVLPAPNKTDGANPTPEEQGYTKQTINGKDVYVKEAGQMIFYYEPKK